MTKLIQDTHTINNKGIVTNTVTKIEIGIALNSTTYTPYKTHQKEVIKVPTPLNKVTSNDIHTYLSKFSPIVHLSNGASSSVGYVMPFELQIDTFTKTSDKQDTRATLGEHLTTMATPKVRTNKDGSIGSIYYSSSWARAIQMKHRINLKDMLPAFKKSVWFRLQLRLLQIKDKQTKRQIRRDIARSKNSITKTDKVIQPSRQKRVKPILPSSK